MRVTTKCVAAFATVFAACGLFPDVGSLDGDGAVDATSDQATDTQANEASTDASTDAHAEGNSVPDACPTGRGPAMVNVDPKTCIDSTEVTVAQYRAFFEAVDAGNFAQPPECSWNTTFDPNGGVPIGKDLNPMDNVNWCKARAFCAWAGKSLCGSPDGGAFPYASFADSTQSVWMRACSNGGAQSYPYGNTLHTSYCNLTPTGDASPGVDQVATNPKCVGYVPGLFDMLGNLSEWENACTSTGDASVDLCRRRGGAFDEAANATCAYDDSDTRNHESNTAGFRCCAILP